MSTVAHQRPRFVLLLAVAIAVAAYSLSSGSALAQSGAVDPAAGPPGTSITVETFDWPPNEVVELRFAGQTLATGEADPEGFVRLTGTVPEDVPPGAHPLDVVGSSGSSVNLSFQVEQPEQAGSPSEEAGGGAGQPGGDNQPGSGGKKDEKRAASTDDEGGSDWIALLVGLLVVLLAGSMLMTAGRGPLPAPVLLGFFSGLWEWLFGKEKRDGGGIQIGPCPAHNWVKVAAGSYVRTVRIEKTETDSPCKWSVLMSEVHIYYHNGSECTLRHGHPGTHLFAPQSTLRDPAAPRNYEEIVRSWNVEIADPDCTKGSGLVKEEAERQYRHLNNRVLSGVTGGGGTSLLNAAPCKVCGEPRGNVSPCPHCGMD